jgi:hypothetical protein
MAFWPSTSFVRSSFRPGVSVRDGSTRERPMADLPEKALAQELIGRVLTRVTGTRPA